MELREILTKIYPLPKNSLDRIVCEADEIDFDRNTVIIEADRIEKYIYFVKSGLLRAYVLTDGREITFWIGQEGAVALSMESYINHRPGYESIATLEPTVLYRIPSEKLAGLYETDIHIANWGRKFAETEIIRAERCLIPHLSTTATDRYENLLNQNPALLNRIPLEKLASYLGITPVSLSRIRGKLGRKQG